jgi:hypothetical protein
MARRIRCRPRIMPEVFKWGDTNPHWDQAVDEYLQVRHANRLCDLINRRGQRDGGGQ